MGLLSLALVFPKTSQAFWPFDFLFGRGEVKGEQTEIRRSTGRPTESFGGGSSATNTTSLTTTISPTPTPTEDEVLAQMEKRLENAWKKS